MQAKVGDWLVVKSSSESRHARRAAILAVSADGGPPYTVRWLDTGREALVFPGPDCVLISAADQAELDRQQAERSARLQDELRAGGGHATEPHELH